MKSVLITGCSSGLGLNMAKEFLERGFRVYGTSRNKASLKQLCSKGLIPITLDLPDNNGIKSMLKDIESLDILINNAGYAQVGPMIDLDQDLVKKQFDVNLFGPIQIIKSFIPKLLESSNPCIVNIGSMSGLMATPLAGAYCSSKAAMNIYTDVLRMELSSLGIQVIKVLPGVFKSSFGVNAEDSISAKSDSLYKDIESKLEVRAYASQMISSSPEKVAKKIVDKMLVKNPPSVITVAKGGYTARFVSCFIPNALKDLIFKIKFKL